jgi:hypothetical protein
LNKTDLAYGDDVFLSSLFIDFLGEERIEKILNEILEKNYYYDVSAASGTGYKITDDILISSLTAFGSPNKTSINKIGIIIDPLSAETSVGLDGLRINDEDTFDPGFGIVSRSVLSIPLIKIAGRQVDIEYRLDLGF